MAPTVQREGQVVEAVQARAAARAAAGRAAWREAYELLAPLEPDGLSRDDLALLADAAWWASQLRESMAIRRRAYARYAGAGEHRAAAYHAWFLSVDHAWIGEAAPASGWLGRAARHLDGVPECVEHGWLALTRADAAGRGRRPSEAASLAQRALAIGRRERAPDLVAMALQTLGRARIHEGRVEEGVGLLDEAMCAVLADELSPLFTGWVFCAVLAACFERADLARAGEWTEAAVAWCDSLATSSPFHGICRVHRVEIEILRGDWGEAEAQGLRAAAELAEVWPDMAGAAHYAVGEVRRRRGDPAGAEAAYETAARLGLDPQPGLALLRLGQGRSDAAAAALRAAGWGEGRPLLQRADLIAARVEVALATGDRGDAGAGADALAALAAESGVPAIAAAAAMAAAGVALADGDAGLALRAATRAGEAWRELRLAHEAARARVLMGRASRLAGDEERARRELAAAREAFARLGAEADARRAAALLGRREPRPGGLSEREVQVLRLVADGRTNRQIAADLVVSEHTVARHLQNAFAKLGVSSRAAAAAFAVEHGLA